MRRVQKSLQLSSATYEARWNAAAPNAFVALSVTHHEAESPGPEKIRPIQESIDQ